MKRACFEEGPQTANTQCPLFGLGRRCIHAPCGEEKTFSTRCAPGFRGQSTRKPAGPTVEGEVPPGAKRLFRHVEAAIADGHSPFCGGCFFLRGGMGDFTKGKRLFAGFRKISSEVQKSSCIVHRCTVYDLIAKKEAGYRRNVGRSRSGDISCRKKDVSCRRPRKARKRCYTERLKLKNCPGAPPDP